MRNRNSVSSILNTAAFNTSSKHHIKDSMYYKSSAVSSALISVIHTCSGVQSRESVLSLAQAAEQMPLSSPESRSYGPRAPHQSGLLHRLLLISHTKRLALMLYSQKILIYNHQTPLHSNLQLLLWKNGPFNKTSEVHKTFSCSHYSNGSDPYKCASLV